MFKVEIYDFVVMYNNTVIIYQWVKSFKIIVDNKIITQAEQCSNEGDTTFYIYVFVTLSLKKIVTFHKL